MPRTRTPAAAPPSLARTDAVGEGNNETNGGGGGDDDDKVVALAVVGAAMSTNPSACSQRTTMPTDSSSFSCMPSPPA
jgi:hypothetical protein